jgi:hypothetical protein
MRKEARLLLPFPSSSLVRDASLRTQGSDLVVDLDFDDEGRVVSSMLCFTKQRAFRYRAETLCTGWHVAGTYDNVCEIEDSTWVEELRGDAVPEWRDYWTLRHFMVYIDGFGCLEVVAESVTVEGKT